MIIGIKEIGFGKHVQALGASSAIKVKNFWLHLWIQEILNLTSTMLVKISILLFFHRAFRFRDFTIYAQIVGGIVLLWGLIAVNIGLHTPAND